MWHWRGEWWWNELKVQKKQLYLLLSHLNPSFDKKKSNFWLSQSDIVSWEMKNASLCWMTRSKKKLAINNIFPLNWEHLTPTLRNEFDESIKRYKFHGILSWHSSLISPFTIFPPKKKTFFYAISLCLKFLLHLLNFNGLLSISSLTWRERFLCSGESLLSQSTTILISLDRKWKPISNRSQLLLRELRKFLAFTLDFLA